ncbi:MAG: helix-turn-helix domain-containing protein [Myxococcota bacterium]
MIHAIEVAPAARRRSARLVQIVDAALDLVTAHGLAGLTMQRLADEVDLTPGALYRYFRSKDALIVAMQQRCLLEIGERLRRAQQEGPWPSAPRPRALAELLVAAATYVQLREEAPRVFALVAATLNDPRPLVEDGEAARIIPVLESLLGEVAKLFAGASEVGALDDHSTPEVRTVLFWSAIQGVASTAKLRRLHESFSLEPLAREAARTLLVGFGASIEDLDEANQTLRQRKGTPS